MLIFEWKLVDVGGGIRAGLGISIWWMGIFEIYRAKKRRFAGLARKEEMRTKPHAKTNG